jgi:septal ring-binding cell division protein DamX
MSNIQPEPSTIQDEPLGAKQVLQWAMCQPGVLLLSSLAVGTMLAYMRKSGQQTTPERRAETEADIVDGDIPLFI